MFVIIIVELLFWFIFEFLLFGLFLTFFHFHVWVLFNFYNI